ncbi:hypothetical protein SAMN05216184_11822 [Georgenia satyanarayanai]|uniref:Uncharacterized protein n=1 Tax=Georgenia satyanarayanai TaxID=860221 RepID=A0A2Y9C7R1_9MICO|nr:hypothetical protein [Georgenia satyanarayanai]PYF96731.1 hypothetical protein A8987_11822 [Georgenia satyanarayanai]SSA46473.1 hypothetical protein SAMN05216184_11822 [Georgenia satyanarayanai]
MSDTSRRLTPAQLLLIVVVSILVLLFVILLAGRLAGGGDEPTDATPSAAASSGTDEATDDATGDETPTEEPEAEYFASPSGNIVCALTPDSADCVISNFQYEPEDADCEDEDAGGHLRVEAAGASMPCEPLVVAGDVPALDYGQTTTAHGFTCESAESGVTCRHDESGYGFAVARASYELF